MKYEITEEATVLDGRLIHRIRCAEPFGTVQAGEKGGWIESEANLSQDGLCWVYDDAKVFGRAHVCEDVPIRGTMVVGGCVVVGGDDEGPIVRNVTEIGGAARIGENGVHGSGYLR